MDDKRLTDAELIALAALAQIEAMSLNAENQARAAAGLAPAYSSYWGEASTKLDAELKRRGILAA